MSQKPEEEIEDKLKQLELSIKEASNSNVPAAIEKSSQVSGAAIQTIKINLPNQSKAGSIKADLHLLGGFALLLAGVLILLLQMQVRFPPGSDWGIGAHVAGWIILMLLIGLGFFFYDYKNKLGWVLMIVSLAALVLLLFAHMTLVLPQMSMHLLIIIFLPIVFGGSLVAKGIKMQSLVENKKDPKNS